MNNLWQKKIIVGVTGGIAAYKSADLIRRLREVGAQVHVVMTSAAKEFITPLTMQAVSGNPVHDDLLDLKAEAAMGHIELARFADAVIVAPASADFIARLAHGHANDLLTALCLATTAPIALAPAMNQQMWLDEATQDNIKLITKHGIHLLGPGEGAQACGEFGMGRMLEPAELIKSISDLFSTSSLAGKRVVVTAGPTQEHIDPVRYLTNHSSGKMGFAVAQAAAEAGAQVTLITGPVQLKALSHVKQIDVVTALEMQAAVKNEISACDIFIAAAAVADYRAKEISQEKQAKSKEERVLHLIPNPDILAEVAALKEKPFVVGFAAQTHDVIHHAKEKLKKKNLNMIAANWVGVKGTGFHSDENELTVLWHEGEKTLPKASKHVLARELIALIAKGYHAKDPT